MYTNIRYIKSQLKWGGGYPVPVFIIIELSNDNSMTTFSPQCRHCDRPIYIDDTP